MPVRDLLMSAGGASAPATYVEDVFSTYLYVGNNTGQTITNGIDLASKGGLVWCKNRQAGNSNGLYDTVRGVGNALVSDTNDIQLNAPAGNEVDAFNSNGFSLGTDYNVYINRNGYNHVSWTFRKQPKFFDVVTYTGDGTAGRTVAHNLGSTPGMIIVKNITTTGKNWAVYNQSLGATDYLALNATDRSLSDVRLWNNTAPTSTQFTLGTSTNTNNSGDTYVAYLFAHNAGGFGTAGTDNVISCGSFTTDGSGNASVTLGYEPQYLMVKRTDSTGNWYIVDVMRGWTMDVDAFLYANLSNAESHTDLGNPTATGFTLSLSASATYIYMAIRRPMKVPTDATTVFSPISSSASANTATSVGFPIDLQMDAYTGGDSRNTNFNTRLIGSSSNSTYYSNFLVSSSTAAEQSYTGTYWVGSQNWNNTSFDIPGFYGGVPTTYYNFSRRPGFFDVVCYTGTGSTNTQITHNLGIPPELIIVKSRSDGSSGWAVYHNSLGINKFLTLNATSASITVSNYWSSTAPTSTTFGTGDPGYWNNNGNEVAYLFATCAGVSKVGSYTGNGTTQAIACGFTGGARFVLIKRTDSTGDWYVYDTARGMTTLTDPYLLLNSTAAETATLGSVTTTTGGFTVNASILSAINTSGASYIFLAIA